MLKHKYEDPLFLEHIKMLDMLGSYTRIRGTPQLLMLPPQTSRNRCKNEQTTVTDVMRAFLFPGGTEVILDERRRDLNRCVWIRSQRNANTGVTRPHGC